MPKTNLIRPRCKKPVVIQGNVIIPQQPYCAFESHKVLLPTLEAKQKYTIGSWITSPVGGNVGFSLEEPNFTFQQKIPRLCKFDAVIYLQGTISQRLDYTIWTLADGSDAIANIGSIEPSSNPIRVNITATDFFRVNCEYPIGLKISFSEAYSDKTDNLSIKAFFTLISLPNGIESRVRYCRDELD